MFVGVQTYSITGDADGNGNPGYTDPQMAAAGGVNYAHFGGDKSLTIAFANVAPSGGLGATRSSSPASRPTSRSAIRGTPTTSRSRPTTTPAEGLAYSYGTILNSHVGQLWPFDPSASQPNFEFAMTNFSKIPGFNPCQGFYISLFLGSQGPSSSARKHPLDPDPRLDPRARGDHRRRRADHAPEPDRRTSVPTGPRSPEPSLGRRSVLDWEAGCRPLGASTWSTPG